MGLLHRYFAAASDAEAAEVTRDGPEDGRFDVLDLPDLDPYIILLMVEAQLRGCDEDQISDGPRFARVVDNVGGASVFTVTDELQEAIAAAPRERLAEVAELVVEVDDDGSGEDEREFWLNALTHHLWDLGDLARRAKADRNRVYAWVSL